MMRVIMPKRSRLATAFAVVLAGGTLGAGVAVADVQALSPYDVQNPAVGNLDPNLLTAVQQAASAAGDDGRTMTITSGWRSPAFQQQLLDDAVATYGSMAAARQWLITNGAQFGLCQIYANEIWHFELATSPAGICPPLLPNAA